MRLPFSKRRSRESDLDDELAHFVEELTARHVQRGMTPQGARRAALAEVGGVQQVREATRESWRFASVETLARDVRYGCRLFARSPGFALVVVLTLGLVIGANATVFSVMHAVLWRPLPYPDAGQIVVIDSETRGTRAIGIADAEARELQMQRDLFTRLGNIMTVDAHVNVDGNMERVPAASVTDDVLTILGAEPLFLGRVLQAQTDEGSTTVRAVVISHGLWVRQFGSDPNVIGRHAEINNLDVQVVGVLRPDFRVYLPVLAGAPEIVDVWFPRGLGDDRRVRVQLTLGRLAHGVSLTNAQSRLDTLAAHAVSEHAAAYAEGGLRYFATPLQDKLTADVRQALWVLAGAVGFVLLIGCVNVATLLLARARARQHEMAVRRALGADRFRLARQLLTEAALLSAAGALVGFAIAQLGVDLLEWLRPTHLPRQTTVDVTFEVALFIAAVTLVVTLVFGLVPIFGTRGSAVTQLRLGHVMAHRAGLRSMQRGMVVAEVALAIVPLVAAGLMLRTFVNMTQTPLGFDPNELVTAKVAFSFRAFPETRDRVRLLRQAAERVLEIPGVDDVSIGTPLPLDGWQQIRTYTHPVDKSVTARATMQSVFPGYLRITRTPLLAGRDITDSDIDEERNVVIVDERVAAQLWPDGAVGRHIVLQRGRDFAQHEIVGVTRAVRATNVRDEALPHIVVPYHVWPVVPSIVIRTSHSAAALQRVVKERVESLGTGRPVFDFRPMQYYVDQSVGDARFMMLVLVGFAGAAILLAAIGLYGTLAYLASQRTQEFGIRMALGASAGIVLRTVAGEGLLLAAIGAALGFAGAAASTGLLQGMLYNVTPFDGVTLLTVVVLVALTALIAAISPAWRAAKTNPTLVLRGGE